MREPLGKLPGFGRGLSASLEAQSEVHAGSVPVEPETASLRARNWWFAASPFILHFIHHSRRAAAPLVGGFVVANVAAVPGPFGAVAAVPAASSNDTLCPSPEPSAGRLTNLDCPGPLNDDMASRPSGDAPADGSSTEIRPGLELRDDSFGAPMRVTYVSEDTVVALTETGMIALPRDWVEADLDRGSFSADGDDRYA